MLGIDPFETKVVEVEGVKFTIGHIIERVMLDIRLITRPFSEELSIAMKEKKMLSPEASRALVMFKYEVVRWGVRGHEKFKIKDREIPFKTEKVERYGCGREVVSDETIEYYAANLLIGQLTEEILAFCSISDAEKKT